MGRWVKNKNHKGGVNLKIYCASDLHIGFELANYKKIIEFFKLVEEDADKLILCGDILDLWRCPIEKIRTDKKMKKVFSELCSLSDNLDITYVWGNHDYKVAKKWKEANDLFKITDEFTGDDGIYYCHGWRFDLRQRLGYFLYGWLVNRFPYLYQAFFKTPIEIKNQVKRYNLLNKLVHDEAKLFIKQEKAKYLIMGHTHSTYGKGKLYDCGDMVDSLSYVVIENGKPSLRKLPRKNK
jgi:UDP-2,3-diacylglucosamine pyrophosphatase LpxH